MAKIKGIIPPVSTIFDENGKLDEKGMGLLIDTLIDGGVNGLFFLGSGGEFSQMSLEERKEVAEFAVSYTNKRVPTFIGTGSTSTREAIFLSRHAESIGADGIVVINPYYWSLSEELLLHHYKEIAQSMTLPVLLYNFPDRTGQDLTPEIVLRIVDQNANIVGIKESVGSFCHVQKMIKVVKEKYPDFSVFCGFDNHLLNTLQLGGDGAIPACSNFAPKLYSETYNAFTNGDIEKASKLQEEINILPLLYNIDSPFINVIKEAIKQSGLNISNYVLPPSRPLSKEKINSVKEILEMARTTNV